jgi:hypothetical protein
VQIVIETKDRVTKSVIEAAWKRRAPNQRLTIRDRECPGLRLVVNARTMSWCYDYRPPGTDPKTGRRWPTRTLVLGSPDALTRDAAKQTVERLKVGRLDGRDPAAARKEAKAAAVRKQAHTLARLLDDYAVALPQRRKMRGAAGTPGNAYVAGELRQVHLAIETIGPDTPASDVTEARRRATGSALCRGFSTGWSRKGSSRRIRAPKCRNPSVPDRTAHGPDTCSRLRWRCCGRPPRGCANRCGATSSAS